MKEVVFSPEKKAMYKNCYLIVNEEMMISVGDTSGLAKENFRAYWVDYYGILQELTVDDFEYYDPIGGDKDFKFSEDEDYIERGSTPEEVRELLDAVIKERMNKGKL